MKVSIITPSLNQGNFLEETINSVVKQKGDFELEYIIIDGQSTDNSLEIIKKYAKKYPFIKYISEKDSGQSEAVNKGFKMFSGEILNWLACDDILTDGVLCKVVDFFEKNRNSNVVFGHNQFIDKNGKVFRYFKSRKFSRPELIKRWSCVYCKFNLPQPSIFVRKKVLNDIGLLDEQNHLCMDYDWYLKINKKYEFYFIDELLSKSRYHSDCKSIKFMDLQYKKSIQVSKKFWKENYFHYLFSCLYHSPYIFTCVLSGKLRKRSPIFNRLMNFLKRS